MTCATSPRPPRRVTRFIDAPRRPQVSHRRELIIADYNNYGGKSAPMPACPEEPATVSPTIFRHGSTRCLGARNTWSHVLKRRRDAIVRSMARHPAGRGLAKDAGMTTAEYAVGIIAAVAFAGVLLKILTSDQVSSALTGIVQRALSA